MYQTNPSYSYVFKERYGKLNWKDVIKIDIDLLIRNNDIAPIEEFIENLVFSNIEDNDMQVIPESFILKLLRTYQYIIEYLMFTQQKVESDNKSIEIQYNTMISDAANKEVKMKENKARINQLKKENKQKEVVLNTYKFLLDDYKKSNYLYLILLLYCNIYRLILTISLYFLILNPSNFLDNVIDKKEFFYCKYCEGKKFTSQEKVDEHITRRHALQISQEQLLKTTLNQNRDKDKLDTLIHDVEIEKKLDGLKTYFENFLMTEKKHNDLFKIMENQKQLEDRIKGIGTGTNPELEKQLQEMKDLLKSQQNKEVDHKDRDEMERTLKKLKDENDQKMLLFTTQIDMLKCTFADELSKLKDKKQQPVILYAQEASSVEIKRKEKQETPPKKVEKAVTPPKKETPPKKIIPKKLFNAAELEDDLDISIEEPKIIPIVKKSTKKVEEPIIKQPEIIDPPKPIVEAPKEIKIEKSAAVIEVLPKPVPLVEKPEPEMIVPEMVKESKPNRDLEMMEKVKRSMDNRDYEFHHAQSSIMKSVKL